MRQTHGIILLAALAALAGNAGADVITDWNTKTGELIAEARIGTPPAIRVMAIVQTAAYAAVSAITQRDPAAAPQADVTRNARLFALTAQAMDDAMIGVFEAKYHYNFWRPVTAIRNGDIDGHDATERDASWAPLIDVPMHPEYPSGHSICAGVVAALLKAEVGTGAMPVLTTTSPSAKGAARRWSNVDDFVREVSEARIHAGIHYRSATEAGAAMGRRIGELAAARLQAAQ